MAAKKKDISFDHIWRALVNAEGNIGRAAVLLGVSRGLLLRRMAEYKELEEARIDRQLWAYDQAWMGIYKAIEEKHWPITKWFLTRYGEDRGYGLKRRPRSIPLLPSQSEDLIDHFRERARLRATLEREMAKARAEQRAVICEPIAGPRPKRTARP